MTRSQVDGRMLDNWVPKCQHFSGSILGRLGKWWAAHLDGRPADHQHGLDL